MAIEISAQFINFTQFAADSIANGEKGADTIARLDVEDPLGGRTVTAKSGDKIGKWVRSDDLKETNDRVRELFRKTVADMFGGEERIPESVRTAMKMEDYDKGKPLSARRISLVKAAVDRVAVCSAQYAEQAIDTLRRNNVDKRSDMTAQRFAALTKTVQDAIVSCGDGTDAMDVIAENIFDICVAGNNALRSEETIRAKVEAIKANFRELREVAGGDPGLFEIGKISIKNLAGKSVPDGALRALVAAARKADVSTIKRLQADTGPVTINRALLQFFRDFDEILHKAGLLAAVADDATMLTGFQNFIGAAMLARFGTAKLHAIQEALTGENAADLDTMLVEGARDWFARVDDITPEELDEAVMGKGGGKPTEKFKEQIRDHMERTGRSGFAMLQSILSTLLGDDKMKELPDDYKGVIPENFKMIVEDYAKDTRRQLDAKANAQI